MSFSYVFSLKILPSIISALFVLVLTVYSFRHRQLPCALPFSIACAFGLFWSIGLIFEYAAVGIGAKIFWRKFQLIMQLPSATAVTCFLLEYAWPRRYLTRRNLLLLSIVPLLMIILIVTNDLHHLFWEGFIFGQGLETIPGPLMKYFIAYIFVNFILNLIVFIWLFIHSPQNRLPVVIVLSGQIMMRVFYFIDIGEGTLFDFPYSAVGIALTSLMYAIAFFRYQILGPMPLARQLMIRQLPIGMLVLDYQGKIHSLNPAAERMLKISDKEAKGLQVADVLPVSIKDSYLEHSDEPIEFEVDNEGGKRYLVLNVSSLRDWRELKIGRLLLLTDISEQRRAQRKIIEQQRVLATLKERELIARELHDDLAQVLSFIRIQGQTIHRLLERGEQQTAQQYLMKLIDAAHSGEINTRESILGMRISASNGGFIKPLKEYLDQFQQTHDIQTELLIPNTFTDKKLDAMIEVQLLRILQEALTNISKHAQADHVRIKFDIIDSSLYVTIKDDGKGFNITEDKSASMNHFGLQMMRERAEAIGSEITLSSQSGHGTVIRVCVPIDGGRLTDD